MWRMLSAVRLNDPLWRHIHIDDDVENPNAWSRCFMEYGKSMEVALAANRVIRSLELTTMKVGVAKHVSEVLRANGMLETVTVHLAYDMACDGKEAAGIALAGGLRANAGLRNFTFDVTGDMPEAAWVALAAALRVNTSLECLRLVVADDMTEAAIVAFGNALQVNSTLQTFSLELLGCYLP